MSQPNPLKLQKINLARGLAGSLLGVWVVVAGVGCVIPQDDVVFPDLPQKKNSPLKIVTWSPPGQREQTAEVGVSSATCKPTVFSVVVNDPDANDQTRSLWYIDRTEGSPGIPGIADSVGSNTRTVRAPNTFANRLSTLVDGKRHLVEVYVTDGDFDQDKFGEASRLPVGTLIDGGPLLDPAYVDFNFWLVQVERCP
jgi:hypothetical protein